MMLPKAIEVITAHLRRMDELYGRPLFNEWAILAVFDRKGRLLHYVGERHEDLHRSVAGDLRHFSMDFLRAQHPIGHFDFSRNAGGMQFDAFIVIGEGCFLVCNNTSQSMAGITSDASWLRAQVPFAELSDLFRSDPLIHLA